MGLFSSRGLKLLILSVLAISLLYTLFFERIFVSVKTFHLSSRTKEAKPLKILQISDLHLQSISYPVRSIAEKVSRLSPDLILLTGDAIDKADNIYLVEDFLKLLNDSIPKAAIPGNWEYWSRTDLKELENIYRHHNCQLLINETIQFIIGEKTVAVTGVDDFVGGNADISLALEDFKPSDLHIVLNHCPEYSAEIFTRKEQDIKIDLILSGHTHGGQVSLFGWTPYLPPGSGGYAHGWYGLNGERMYVSRGVGTSLLPLRFGARAEIAVFYW